jgi:hypothetical protein
MVRPLNDVLRESYPGMDQLATFNNAVYDLLVDLRARQGENKNAFTYGLQSINLSYAGAVAGTSDTKKTKSSNTVTYAINGVMYQKSAFEQAFTATSDDITNASGGNKRRWIVSLDSSGNSTKTRGEVVSGSETASFPATPQGNCAVYGLEIEVGEDTPFDATTDAMSDGHLSVTYYNLIYNPADYGSITAISASSPSDPDNAT